MKAILSLFLFIFLVSCQSGSTDSRKDAVQTLFADTIVYEALIHNIDPSAPWQNDWLKGLDRDAYINKLFELAYNKRLKVVDYDTQEILTIDEIKEWDTNNPRSTIGKLQFTETWAFENGQFTKQIIAILPAYEVFTDEGELRAYKAKLKMVFE